MEPAEERFSASTMMSSSIRLWLALGLVDWITKVSSPRTFSPISTWISPSEKAPTLAVESSRPRLCTTAFASAGLELPAKTLYACAIPMTGALYPSRARASSVPRELRRDVPVHGLGGGAAPDLPLVLVEDRPLHPLAGLGVQRVGDVLEGPVLAPLRGHGHEEAGGALDHLEAADHEAGIQRDGHVRLELVFLDREDADLGDFHGETPGIRVCVRATMTSSPAPPTRRLASWRAADRALLRPGNDPKKVGPLPDIIGAIAPA